MMRSSKKIQLFFIIIIFVFSISAIFPQSKKEVKQWNKWQKKVTKTKDTDKQIKILRKFIIKYPKHFFNMEARAKVAEISFLRTKKENTFDAYKKYSDKFPESKYIPQVKEKIAGFAYKKAKKEDKIKAYEEFIAKYPDSKFVAEANDTIKSIKRLKEFKFIKKSELDKLILGGSDIAAATSINTLLGVSGSDTMSDLLKGEWAGSYSFKYNGKSFSFPIRIIVTVEKANICFQYFDKKGNEIVILKEKIRKYHIFKNKILLDFIYGKMSIKSNKIVLGANVNFNMQELISFIVELKKTK